MSETLDTVDGRHVLRLTRHLPHSPERVWSAVTEPEHLRQWFPAEVRLAPHTGGEIRCWNTAGRRTGARAGGSAGKLTAGTGHGARLILTQTGPTEAVETREIALRVWRDRIGALARQLAEAADRVAG
mgnify:CR=1 FL=1